MDQVIIDGMTVDQQIRIVALNAAGALFKDTVDCSPLVVVQCAEFIANGDIDAILER